MINFITDNALVINKKDFGEADRYITVFTENFGRMSFLIKGVRKSKKRELSSVDILSLSNFNFYRKKDNYIVNNFTNLDSYLEIKENLGNLEIALYFLALLNKILVENNRKKSLYKITLKCLNFLKNSEDERKNFILIGYYLYYIIKDEGLKIGIEEGNYFSYESSTFFKEKKEYTVECSNEVKEIIKLFVLEKTKNIINGEYLLQNIKSVVSLLEKYINFHLGIDIKLKNYIMEG